MIVIYIVMAVLATTVQCQQIATTASLSGRGHESALSERSQASIRQLQGSLIVQEKIDLDRVFKNQVSEAMYVVSQDFIDSSVQIFTEYLDNMTRQAIFDQNMQFPEFIYIFRDKEENTIPSQSKTFNKNLLTAGELKVKYITDFQSDLTASQIRQLEIIIEDYINHLKDNLKSIAFYPNTHSMKQALLDAINTRFEIFSNDNFDELFYDYCDRFQDEIKELLELDDDTRQLMSDLRKDGEGREWIHHQGEPGYNEHKSDSGLDLNEVYKNMHEFEHNHHRKK